MQLNSAKNAKSTLRFIPLSRFLRCHYRRKLPFASFPLYGATTSRVLGQYCIVIHNTNNCSAKRQCFGDKRKAQHANCFTRNIDVIEPYYHAGLRNAEPLNLQNAAAGVTNDPPLVSWSIANAQLKCDFKRNLVVQHFV